MFPFFESIKIDNGRAWNLAYHAQRVDRTIRAAYGKEPGWDLAQVIATSEIPKSGLFKCRVAFDQYKYSIEFDRYTIRSINTLKLVNADEIEYAYKYVDRTALDNLLQLRGGCDDVLMIKRGRITDTSVANIVLLNDQGEWWTPADCLLKGTMRQSLLDSGRIFEVTLGIADLGRFKKFKLINAMRDWDVQEADVSNIIE